MEEYKMEYRSHKRYGATFGLILILVGALFLAFNFGLLQGEWKHVIFSWQMLLVVIGLFCLFSRHFFNGLILISVGGFFILPRLAIVSPETFWWVAPDFTHVYWPVLLIIGGLLLILSMLFRPKRTTVMSYANSSRSYQRNRKEYYTKQMEKQDGKYAWNAIFGGIEEIILDPEFKGGELNAVFGSITLDLRKTNLPEGETVIEMNAVFGGVTIFVPENWDVQIHLDRVFAGFQDNRILSNEVDRSRQLIINGACVFGGGEIKN